MMERHTLTSELLRQILLYDPETGALTWRARPVTMFINTGCGGAEGNAARWNAQWAGKPAFTAKHSGYHVGRLYGKNHQAHRIIWILHHGKVPDAEIDHINGDRSDNRICNLREATRAQNSRNVGALSTNTSGYKGVSWFKPVGMWRATINFEGKQISLGYFRTAEAAHAAYCEAVKKYHGEYGRVA